MEELLKQILQKLNNLEEGQVRIEAKLNSVVDQTAFLTEFRTETNLKLDEIVSTLTLVEGITSKNWNDIALLKRVK